MAFWAGFWHMLLKYQCLEENARGENSACHPSAPLRSLREVFFFTLRALRSLRLGESNSNGTAPKAPTLRASACGLLLSSQGVGGLS
jgi:hypothetical protein